jgi:hypothetical protein
VKAVWYARDLRKLCDQDRQSSEYGMCWSFVTAVFEIMTKDSIYGLRTCPPRLVTSQRAVEITAAWLLSHPKSEIEAASLVVARALAQAFPCQGSH